MSMPDRLGVALKEWASVCEALASGRQMILLRKGGIADNGGIFELAHSRFVLFPTYLHQNVKMLKEETHGTFVSETAEPSTVQIATAAEVTDIVVVRSRAAMDALDAEHIWMPGLIDMRFGYKPSKPLYLLLLRAFRLKREVVIANTQSYAGCISWVPLEQEIDTSAATAVLDDAAYGQGRDFILRTMSGVENG